MRNARNALCLTDPKLANAYAKYIDGLVKRYGAA